MRPKETDPRFKWVCDFYCEESRRRYGVYQWDASDGKALARLLQKQPQISVDRWEVLLRVAFNWAKGGHYCPLAPGFRFREFASQFVKIAARIPEALRAQREPTVKEITAWIAEKLGLEALIPEEKRLGWWDDMARRYLGISLARAKEILDADGKRG